MAISKLSQVCRGRQGYVRSTLPAFQQSVPWFSPKLTDFDADSEAQTLSSTQKPKPAPNEAEDVEEVFEMQFPDTRLPSDPDTSTVRYVVSCFLAYHRTLTPGQAVGC